MLLAAKNIVEEFGERVSLPAVVTRVSAMVDDERFTASDIGEVLGQDPILCMRLLRIANSPLFDNYCKIESINHAVLVLGTRQIRELVFTITATRLFNNVLPVEDFWQYSLLCGLLARELAEVSRRVNPDSMLIAGLLHDIGQLVLMHHVPEQAAAARLVMQQVNGTGELSEAELQLLGFTHAEVGASLARQWQLPALVTECIAHHHQPTLAEQFPEAVAHVHIADAIVSMPGVEMSDITELTRIESSAWQLAGVDSSSVERCVARAREKQQECWQLLFDD